MKDVLKEMKNQIKEAKDSVIDAKELKQELKDAFNLKEIVGLDGDDDLLEEHPNNPKQNPRRFARSSTDKKISGVCGGIAAWFGCNSKMVRIIAVLLSCVSCGWAVLLYLLLIVIMPVAPAPVNATVRVAKTREVNKDYPKHTVNVEAKTSDGTRDYSKYSVNGEGAYGKARMVEAAVNLYISNHPQVTVTELKSVFPDSLNSQGVIKSYEEGVKDEKRWYIAKLSNGKKCYISNQWGISNIDNFIEYVNANVTGIKIAKL